METSTTLGNNAVVGTKLKRLKGTRKQFYLRVLSVRKNPVVLRWRLMPGMLHCRL